MNNVYESILRRLASNGVPFDELEHDSVYTMADVERCTEIPAEARVKTMLVKRRTGGVVACGITGGGRLDIRRVAAALGDTRSSLSLATPTEIEILTGIPVGAIGLVFPDDDTPVLLSETLRNKPKIYCGIGRNDRTLAASPSDLFRLGGFRWADIE